LLPPLNQLVGSDERIQKKDKAFNQCDLKVDRKCVHERNQIYALDRQVRARRAVKARTGAMDGAVACRSGVVKNDITGTMSVEAGTRQSFGQQVSCHVKRWTA
jgi:hypothetical protein